MRKTFTFLFATLIVSTAIGSAANAQDWHDRRDIHEFHQRDYDHWRRGQWFQTFHEGRNGWWWVVDGDWYSYPAPIYPYPTPYAVPHAVVEQGGPTVVAQTSISYYCVNPPGYYPSIPQCYSPWRRVESTVGPAQPPIVMAPPPPPSSLVATEESSDYAALNAFSHELRSIDLRSRQAPARLKNLNNRLEAFKKSLDRRNYNAVKVLKDADDLHHRVAIARGKVEKGHPPPPAANNSAALPFLTPAPASSPFVPQD